MDNRTYGELWTMLFKLRDEMHRTEAGRAALDHIKHVLTVMAEYERYGTPISWTTAELVTTWREESEDNT